MVNKFLKRFKKSFRAYDLLFLAAMGLALAVLLAYQFPCNAAARLHGWERIWATWIAWGWLLFH